MTGVTHDLNTSVPESLIPQLQPDNPRLVELRSRYQAANVPMCSHTWWSEEYVKENVDLRYFRGDNAYIWQKRHMAGAVELRYYLHATDVQQRDTLNLFSKLSEDGAFGCWVYKSRKFPALSRDLLDSVNELNFLERHIGISSKQNLRILDIGAGYGRLAYRSIEALHNLNKYYCVDAVPESTFLSEIYLAYRHCMAKVAVVPIDKLGELSQQKLDIAINVHSFSEMNLNAIEGWLDLVRTLGIPYLFIVPNDAESFLTMEADGTRLDFLDALESRGYFIAAKEPTIADSDARELIGVDDYHFLFKRRE